MATATSSIADSVKGTATKPQSAAAMWHRASLEAYTVRFFF